MPDNCWSAAKHQCYFSIICLDVNDVEDPTGKNTFLTYEPLPYVIASLKRTGLSENLVLWLNQLRWNSVCVISSTGKTVVNPTLWRSEVRMCPCCTFVTPQSLYRFFLSAITLHFFSLPFPTPLFFINPFKPGWDTQQTQMLNPSTTSAFTDSLRGKNTSTIHTSIRPLSSLLAVRPTCWVLVVLMISMFQCYLSPLQFLSSKADRAFENQWDLNHDEMDKEHYTSFFLRPFSSFFSFFCLLFVFSLSSLSHAFRRGHAALGLSGNR